MFFLLLQRSNIVTDIHMYYEKDTPPMNNQGEGEKGGAFLLALMGEPPDSGFLVGMRAGSVEQVPVAQ